MAKQDYYELLGVNKNASADELKKAYRQAALKHHPDRAKSDDEKKSFETTFKQINEAYDVPKDPKKRAAYDQLGHAAFEQGGYGQASGFGGNPFGGGFGFDFNQAGGFSGAGLDEDIFDLFFGNRAGGRQRRGGPAGGRDLHYAITIPFDTAVHGGQEQVKLEHLAQCATCQGSGAAKGSEPVTCDRCGGNGEISQTNQSIFGQFATVTPCPKCHGEGKIIANPCPTCGGKGRTNETEQLELKIPAGVDAGTEMRFAGKGDAGLRGGKPGDLYIEFHVQPHNYFKRRGNDIYLQTPLTYSQAALGDTIDVPTIDGTTKVKIPAGVADKTEIRLSGKGVPRLGSNGRGDQYLVIDVVIPKKPSNEEKKLLDQLRQVETSPHKPWD